MCEFRGVMVFPPTCRKVHEGCAAVVRWCANLVNSRMEQEEYKLGIPLCSQPVASTSTSTTGRARAFFPCPAAVAARRRLRASMTAR
jgi:hypothetical protein